MEDLKQYYLDEMLSLSNDLGIKYYHNDKIDIRFRKECENMIDELKGKFNGMSIEINKKKELQQLEQAAKLSTNTTVWEELVEKLFCKFNPDSYDGEEEMLDEGENRGIDPLEFISRVNSSFDKHKKIDGRTKKVLFHAWMNGSWNKRRIDHSILCNNKTTTESFFKPYLITRGKCDTKKEDEQS
ncbi:hypothetical protein Tco_0404562 [Tanacetum coccineum]